MLTAEATCEPIFMNTPDARTLGIGALQLENRPIRIFICCGQLSHNITWD